MIDTKENRANFCEQTYWAARKLALNNGLVLINPSDGCYQLRTPEGWIYNLYPRRQGSTPRIYIDPNHKGPYLPFENKPWNFFDIVRAVINIRKSLTKTENQS